jgi:hypothetical protein
MSEHSKEPWRLSPDELDVLDADGFHVLDLIDVAPSDKKLFIACVNALAGLKPEHVKELVEAVTKVDDAVVANELTELPFLLVRMRVALAKVKVTTDE